MSCCSGSVTHQTWLAILRIEIGLIRLISITSSWIYSISSQAYPSSSLCLIFQFVEGVWAINLFIFARISTTNNDFILFAIIF